MNLFFIDTETTGYDTKKHEIIELAFAIVIDGVTHCKMELFMRPERWDTINQDALKTNRWTIDRLKKLPSFSRDLYCNILHDIIEKYVDDPINKFKIIEYGNNFDSRFLAEFYLSHSCYQNSKFYTLFQKESINVLSLAKKKLPGLKPYRLRDVAKHLRIPVHDGLLHGGGYDRNLLIEVYKKLGGRF